jgi:cytochrome c-type biogenesis protein CcsB
MLESFQSRDSKRWNESTAGFATYIREELGRNVYPAQANLDREIHYSRLRPFRLAWIGYLLCFAILASGLVTGRKIFLKTGAALLGVSFLLHVYGFILRCWISGRPPVTNMYESVIWVTWGCMLFSIIIGLVYKKWIVPTAASVFTVVGLVLADLLPAVLDPSIQPLEPVLRSNFWLTIHVLTITLSYAAFALSLCIGNVVLGNYIFSPGQKARITQLSFYMYRAIQIGVVLLASGTILGGIWADYSWGRFWGWDPKEVWALIALLLYLAVLHGRFSGWLKGFGFTASTVLSFLGVLMAWYGVNFVLGAGLHSYGFGSGGIEWVLVYITLQVGFIVWAYQKNAA